MRAPIPNCFPETDNIRAAPALNAFARWRRDFGNTSAIRAYEESVEAAKSARPISHATPRQLKQSIRYIEQFPYPPIEIRNRVRRRPNALIGDTRLRKKRRVSSATEVIAQTNAVRVYARGISTAHGCRVDLNHVTHAFIAQTLPARRGYGDTQRTSLHLQKEAGVGAGARIFAADPFQKNIATDTTGDR